MARAPQEYDPPLELMVRQSEIRAAEALARAGTEVDAGAGTGDRSAPSAVSPPRCASGRRLGLGRDLHRWGRHVDRAATVIVWVGALHAIFIPPYLGLKNYLEEKTDAGCGRRSPRRSGSRAGAAPHHRGCAPGSGFRHAAWVTCIGPTVWCKPDLFSLVQRARAAPDGDSEGSTMARYRGALPQAKVELMITDRGSRPTSSSIAGSTCRCSRRSP
jgi:hypothetical protein